MSDDEAERRKDSLKYKYQLKCTQAFAEFTKDRDLITRDQKRDLKADAVTDEKKYKDIMEESLKIKNENLRLKQCLDEVTGHYQHIRKTLNHLTGEVNSIPVPFGEDEAAGAGFSSAVHHQNMMIVDETSPGERHGN